VDGKPGQGETAVPRDLAGLVVAGGDEALAAGAGGEHHLVGDIILVGGGVAWALYNIVARRDSSGASPVVITHCQTLAGAVGVTLLSLTGSAT